MNYTDDINRLTHQYNDAIRALEDSFDMEDTIHGWDSSSNLKRQYSKRYEALVSEYRVKCKQVLNDYKRANPDWGKWYDRWPIIFIASIICCFVGCTSLLVIGEEETSSALMDEANTTYWNADNIPIPYLEDHTQYVSNPDTVLSLSAVSRINEILQRIEKEMDIQTIVIAVNHIENNDPFRMAQDVGNKYGVGYNDRGLMIVLGYLDHSINMSPGRALEADLTDAECYRLQQEYVVPAMRAEMPDSGMIYLTEAVYSILKKKELPQMSALSSQKEDDAEEDLTTIMAILMLAGIAGTSLFLKLNGKYHWIRVVGAVSLLPNPFYEETTHISGGGGFGGFSGGGDSGGGFSGGSFGGGSFGGGGATSRW